jgi:hypothetical protein
MKCLATVLAILGLITFTPTAHAISPANPGDDAPTFAKQHRSSGRSDAAYALAVRQGGSCGLTVERMVYGRSDHVLNGWNPWLAREWSRFPITAGALGMVVVWRNGRHVGLWTGDNGDGTISVGGSVTIARVRLRDVYIVNPHADRRRHYART